MLAVYLIGFLSLWSLPALAVCRPVDHPAVVTVNRDALTMLKRVGIGEDDVFAALKDVSIPEAKGCWNTAIGNFDQHLLSAGACQWNLGQGTLQGLLSRFRRKFPTDTDLDDQLDRLMPVYGRRLFSPGCLRDDVARSTSTAAEDCRAFLLSVQTPRGNLHDDFKGEVESLFASDAMIQIQTDEFVSMLTAVAADLGRLFPTGRPSARQIKWAIDLKIQQKTFPTNGDVRRIRSSHEKLDAARRTAGLLSIMRWYEGLCLSVDQEGVRHDCDFNVKRWTELIGRGALTSEQEDLLLLTHLRSRVADGQGGLYQALCFQRRTKIALGVGSVGGRKD